MAPKIPTRLATFLSPANRLQLKVRGQLKRIMCLSLVIVETIEKLRSTETQLQAFEVDSSLKAVVFKCTLQVQLQEITCFLSKIYSISFNLLVYFE